MMNRMVCVYGRLLVGLSGVMTACQVGGGTGVEVAGFRPMLAAPPARPMEERSAPVVAGRVLAGDAPYSIGEPTDEEQWYVELINRARADPAAEGLRLVNTDDPRVVSAMNFFAVNRQAVVDAFAAMSPAPPVVVHPQLTEAARRHTADMLAQAFQGHDGSDGSSSSQRVTEAGYIWNRTAENVFAYAESVWHGHAGFNIDWGNGPGGIQDPPGHRLAIHNALLREIGVGVIWGRNGNLGPQLVTQVFGTRHGAPALATGVVHYDFNGNEFYDAGEGIGGVRVRVGGLVGISAGSGGYAVPLPGNGTHTLTFEVPGLAPVTRTVTVSGGNNLKVDHRPVYAAPVLGGATVAYTGRDNAYVFSPVGGATGYQWRALRRIPWSTAEGAESGLGRFEADTSAGYDVVTTGARASGSRSFRLAHPSPPVSQYLTLRRPLRLSAQSVLTFQSRLGTATSGQVARVQVSNDGGAVWTEVWNQAGSGQPGEQTFRLRQVSLSEYAGQTVSLRFAYTFGGGSFFGQTSVGVGWYVDDILVSGAEEMLLESESSITGTLSLAFRPSMEGPYALQVRPWIGDRAFPWGPALSLVAVEGGPALPTSIELLEWGWDAGGEGWRLEVQLTGGSGGSLEVERALDPSGTWELVEGVIWEGPDATGRAVVRMDAAAGEVGFFRVLAR